MLDRRIFLVDMISGVSGLLFTGRLNQANDCDVISDYLYPSNLLFGSDKGNLSSNHILRAGKPTQNGTVYPAHVLKKIVKDFNDSKRPIFGQIGMPVEQPEINLLKISHQVIDLSLDGEYLRADIQLLSTPQGKILKELLRKDHIVFRTHGTFRRRFELEFNYDYDEVRRILKLPIRTPFIVPDDFKILSINAVPADADSL